MNLEKTNETEPVITIPDSKDTVLGYLNNSNIHFPFVLENKTWPTVEHYVLAKRFEGTTLEEEIRKAKNVYKARFLAKPTRIIIEEDGRIVKKVVYGSKASTWCTIREDWGDEKELEYLEKAIRAKFRQNKKAMVRLLKTEGIRIINNTSLFLSTGSILEKIRDEFLEEKRRPDDKRKQIRKFAAPYADIGTSMLTEEEQNMVLSMITSIQILKEMESISCNAQTTLEMFEDVFYNFLGNVRKTETLSSGEEILSVIKNWCNQRSSNWTEVTRSMPKYESLMRNIENIIKTSPIGGNTQAQARVKISIFVSSLIRWLRMDATLDERKTFFNRAKNIKKENFILPPLRRSYRVHEAKEFALSLPEGSKDVEELKPKDVKKIRSTSGDDETQKAVKRGALYVDLFRKKHNLDTKSFSTAVDYLEKMPRQTRKKWLKNFENLDVERQKEKLQSIILKT